ncbi:MAG: hypothetical protein CME66_04825 [Halobacteriovoraceae bacterium]|nr:hypothetical protein [Halobacteriovoraceae bacterium]
MSLGKKLYKSKAMVSVQFVIDFIACILFLNLYFQTFKDPLFIKHFTPQFNDVLDFHLMYPQNLIVYLMAVLTPAIYYGHIRGVVLYEKGIVINRGLPFFNMAIPYSMIEKYEVIYKKYFISIKRKDTQDEYMFTVRNIDRAVAIFDQQGIKGDLGHASAGHINSHKKLIFIFFVLGVLISLVQYSGFVGEIFR